jgi:hypothetical protein
MTSDQASGLLGVALGRAKQKTSVSEVLVESPPSPETDQTATPLGIVTTGLDSVTSFFQVLHSRAGFRKGALLIAVMGRAELVPCSVTGFDEVTTDLLEVDAKKASLLFDGSSSDSHSVLSRKNRDEVKMLFSDRDFETLDEIFLSPVYAEKDPISLLILSGIADKQIRETQSMLNEDYAIIVKAHYTAIKEMDNHRIKPAKELDGELELMRESSRAGLSPLLYKISFESVIENIAAAHSFINTAWLQSEMRFVVGSLLRNLGNLYELDERSVMLVCQHASELDDQLIAHQASTRLRSLYSNTEAPLSIEIENQKIESLSTPPV